MKNIILIAGLALFMLGCDGNHIIGDLPDCINSVTDECVPEVIEEFCEDGEVCETCEVCEVCETCETCEVCEDPEPPTCFERVPGDCEWVCIAQKTFCTKTFGHCECNYERVCDEDTFVEIDCPVQD